MVSLHLHDSRNSSFSNLEEAPPPYSVLDADESRYIHSSHDNLLDRYSNSSFDGYNTNSNGGEYAHRFSSPELDGSHSRTLTRSNVNHERSKSQQHIRNSSHVLSLYSKLPLTSSASSNQFDHRNSDRLDYYGNDHRGYYSSENLDVMSPLKSFSSSDHRIEASDAHCHGSEIEEMSRIAPPPITPFSGKLTKVSTSEVVRPIAFKPISKPGVMSPPIRQSSPNRMSLHGDEGYGSQDYHFNQSNLYQTPLRNENSVSISSESCGRPSDHGDRSAQKRYSRHNNCGHNIITNGETPSPSDSGVCELEAILREREAEIASLRKVMEKNERVMFQVYEEKRLALMAESHELKSSYDEKLKAQQRKMFKMEQQLMLQLYKCQQDYKSLKDDHDLQQSERSELIDRNKSLDDEIDATRKELEELKWDKLQKSGEITQLKMQCKEYLDELSVKTQDTENLKTELKICRLKIDKMQVDINNAKERICLKDTDINKLRSDYNKLLNSDSTTIKEQPNPTEAKSVVSMQISNGSFNSEISNSSDMDMCPENNEFLKEKLEEIENKYSKDKELWLEEKNKVIRYQKQLQLNYVQMYRKNKNLEAEVEQLSLELENRDMKLLALRGEESAC